MSKKKKNTIKLILSKNIDINTINIHIAQLEDYIYEQNVKNIEIDFNDCVNLKPNGMLRLCSFVKKHKKNDVVFTINANKNHSIRKLLINYNWGSILDKSYQESSYNGILYTPAISYTNPAEQLETVNRIMNVLLSACPEISRDSFGTIEWLLNEVMDNVIVHSNSEIGGIVQLRVLRTVGKEIEITVSDSGIGIPKSLKTIFSIKSDAEILMASINEGVTNGSGQGNGLYGTTQICRATNGEFKILSGRSSLELIPYEGVAVKLFNSNFHGTTVFAKIKTNDIDLLENALNFNGDVYHPLDFIETNYENFVDESNYKYLLNRNEDAVGSRIYGKSLRQRLLNILKMSDDILTIEIDFANIPMISSSFADELISKIIEIHGKEFFVNKIIISNCNSKITKIIDKVCIQRNQCRIHMQ